MIAWAMRDYCRTAGTRTAFIDPDSPWENPFVESFDSRIRDELISIEEFATLLEAHAVVEVLRPARDAGGEYPGEETGRVNWS